MAEYKELILLRHGKSDWNTNTSDFNRPLNKRGNRSVLQMSEWLLKQKLVPDLIISSPATRAITTAKIISETMGLATKNIQPEKIIYEASVADLKKVLSKVPNSIQRIILVGHNPSFEYLVHELAPHIPAAKNGNLMPTAAIAYLQLDSQWSFLQGDSFIQRPKDLN